MKKMALLILVLLLLSSMSLTAGAVVSKAATGRGSGMRIGAGSYVAGGSLYLGGAGYSTIKFVGETFTGGVGVNFSSLSANNATNSSFGVAGQFGFNMTGGTIPTHIGAGLSFNSIPGGSVFTVSLLYGAETILDDHFLVGFDLIPLTFASQSANNATTTVMAVGTGGVYGSYLF